MNALHDPEHEEIFNDMIQKTDKYEYGLIIELITKSISALTYNLSMSLLKKLLVHRKYLWTVQFILITIIIAIITICCYY